MSSDQSRVAVQFIRRAPFADGGFVGRTYDSDERPMVRRGLCAGIRSLPLCGSGTDVCSSSFNFEPLGAQACPPLPTFATYGYPACP